MSSVIALAALSPRQRALLELRLKERRRQQAPLPLDESVALVTQAEPGPFPLSFSQQRLWFVDQLEGRSSLYNVASAVRLSGRLAPEILRRAFGEVVHRHEALRTTFGLAGGEPVQIIGAPGAPADMALPLIDLGGMPAADRAPLARRLAAELARLAFDLARGPLLGQSLLRLGDGEHVLVSVMHHIISDWWSLRLLVRELAALYGAFARGLPSPLPPLPIQYRDFAVWQRRWLQGEVLAGELAYWRTRLAGAPGLLRLPLDRPRPAVQSFRGTKRSFGFPAELGTGLKALARREGSTLFVVFLTAFHILLHHHSGQDDIVVSAPFSYRNRAESEGMIGFLVNTLLLRGNLAGNPSLRALLRRIHTGVLDDMAHQHLPLDRVIEELAPGRSLSYSPFLQVGINFGEDIAGAEPLSSGTAGLADLSMTAFDFAPAFAQFELNLVLSSTGQGLTGSLQYRTELFSAARIDQWIAEYHAILAQLLADLDVDLEELRGHLVQRMAATSPTPSAEAPALEGFALSPQQERQWSLAQESPGLVVPCAFCAVDIRGPLASVGLERALGAVVARHEILRTTFKAIPGMTGALQVVSEGAPLAWREVTFASTDPRGQDEDLDDLIEELRREPLDLAVGPVLQATLAEFPTRRVLVLCLPALCADGATLDYLVAELARALSTGWGDEAVLQYADVAQWEQDLRASAAPAEGPVAVLAGTLGAALPFAAPRETPGSVAPGICTLAMPPIPPMPHPSQVEAVLLTAWQTLLRRLAIPANVVPGVGVPGRRLAELQAVLGPLDFYLPLAWAPGELPFSERVVATAAALGAAREEPLDQALRRLLLCDFGFDFAELPAGLAAGAVTLTPVRRQVHGERFRLRLSCLRQGEGLTAALHFDTATFGKDDVRRLGEWYLALLGNALDAPATAVEDLALLRPAERRQVLAARRATRVDWGAATTLPELFAAQAGATPQAIALLSAGRLWTYGELDRAVDRLAARLAAQGAGPEVRIALAVERSTEMVVAILAILRTGAAYVPLDPDFPADRLRYMLADSRAALLVTAEHLLAGLAVGAVPALLLAAVGRGDGDGELALPPSQGPILPESLAYVIYTSGSTGKPKGVMMSQQAIANRILWMRREFPLTADDTVLFKTPYSFDASIWEIFLPLVSGARLAIAEPGGHRDPSYLLSTVAEHRVTTLQLVPSQLAMLLEARDLLEQGGSLARLFCGGEALPAELVRRFAASLPAVVCNLYGPTEAAIDATFHRCAPEVPTAPVPPAPVVPIGRPLSNVQVHVLDRHLEPLPEGLAGELHIGGDGLARGYLGRPDLTAERFVPNPWSDRPGDRLYRTGDLARYRPACGGSLEFLGRADGQVKIRGFRLELGEIEAALASHPEIAAAAVVARLAGTVGEIGSGELQLVAYYQPAATKFPSPRDLREFLLRSLPEPMVPTVYVALAALPSTPSGKVDRNALPEPGRGAHLPAEFIAPRTAVEQALAGIWASLLGLERVGANDNFFALGGHSLQGMRLVAHVREALGVELRVRSVFEHPTLAGLAQVVTGEMVQQLGEDLVAELLTTGSSAPAAAGGESA